LFVYGSYSALILGQTPMTLKRQMVSGKNSPIGAMIKGEWKCPMPLQSCSLPLYSKRGASGAGAAANDKSLIWQSISHHW
jgi:hypothetical protein